MAKVLNISKNPCEFCGSSKSNELKTGKLYQYEDIAAHYFCLLLSSNLCSNGEDDEGIMGFLPNDIKKELRRGKRLRCSVCKKIGATIGCCERTCKKAFHLPCSNNINTLHQFFGSYMTYCNEHKPYLEPVAKCRVSCCICLGIINTRDPYKVLKSPCCKNSFFHKDCIGRQAITSGYFFKCPLCNNTEEFKMEMLNMGIYIPEQDAAWELEQNAFREIYERHSRCDAYVCMCPKGRNYDKDDCPWEVVLCTECGSEGCHMECGNISESNRQWQCPGCINVLKKLEEKKSSSVHVTPNSEFCESSLLKTPENMVTPRSFRQRRFAQLNEYNLSPNGLPVSKDDDCSCVRRSPRSTSNIYSRSRRGPSLRQHMENKKIKKVQALTLSMAIPSTSSLENKAGSSHLNLQDENILEASTSKVSSYVTRASKRYGVVDSTLSTPKKLSVTVSKESQNDCNSLQITPKLSKTVNIVKYFTTDKELVLALSTPVKSTIRTNKRRKLKNKIVSSSDIRNFFK